jgi:hypothetical protein
VSAVLRKTMRQNRGLEQRADSLSATVALSAKAAFASGNSDAIAALNAAHFQGDIHAKDQGGKSGR